MRKILSLFIILSSFSAAANLPDIVALVNDQPITKYDFQSRKKTIIALNNTEFASIEMEKLFNTEVLSLLIQEEVLFQHAAAIGLNITEEEIDKHLEYINNMSENSVVSVLKEKGINSSSFRNKIKGSLIFNKILGSLSHSIFVPEDEISLELTDNKQEFDIEAWVFTAKDNTDKVLKQMQIFKKNINPCDKVENKSYEEFADGEKFDRKLIQLPDRTRAVILDTNVGSSSELYKENDRFKLLFVCKKDKIISAENRKEITKILHRQKASKQFQRFLKTLESKADIRLMISG